MHFGEVMRDMRIKVGYVSVAALANAFNIWREKAGKSGVAWSTLQQWERFGNPSPEGARDMLAFLGVTEPEEVLAALDTIQRNPRKRFRQVREGADA